MPEIRPFRALHYDTERSGCLSKLLAPPFDIISPTDRSALLARSGCNIVELEKPEDPQGGDPYGRAARILKEWMAEGVLRPDPQASLYVNDQKIDGVTQWRRGLMCVTRLEQLGQGVLPHEHTLSGPKADRLRLLQACQANLSPVMMLYEDPDQRIERLIGEALPAQPLAEAEPRSGDCNRLYSFADRETIRQIATALRERHFYIADGHHRYETALTYMRERSAIDPSLEAAFRFVLTIAISTRDPGLIVWPYHRVVRNLPENLIEDLPEQLAGCAQFRVQPLGANVGAEGLRDALQREADAAATFGFITRAWTAVVSYTGPIEPQGSPRARLDVTVLEQHVLHRLLGLDDRALDDESRVSYTHDAGDAVGAVREGAAQIALLLRPTRLDQLAAVARAGEKMPRKSTYFYPKPWSGLVIHHFPSAS